MNYDHASALKQKIESLVQEKQIVTLYKDHTNQFQKYKKQKIYKCKLVIDRHQHKFLLQIKFPSLKFNVMIKRHKDNKPIILVFTSIQAPPQKLARFIGRELSELIELRYTFSTKNTRQLAQELATFQVNKSQKMITLDVKYLYVNLPMRDILKITSLWFRKKNNNDSTLAKRNLELFKVILNQNYFQYGGKMFKLTRGIAMGSRVSDVVAELYLQYSEDL